MLITITGVSGSGKSTIVNNCFDDEHTIVSYTTRPPRPQEKEGHDYYFTSQSTLRMMHMADDILEYSRFNGNEYAVTKSEILNKMKNGTCVMIANADGVEKLSQVDFLKGKLFPVIIKDSKEKIKDNLSHRKDTKTNIEKRIALIDEENKAIEAMENDLFSKNITTHVIVGDKLNQTELIDLFKKITSEIK